MSLEADQFDIVGCITEADRLLRLPGRPGALIVEMSADPELRASATALCAVLKECLETAEEIAAHTVGAPSP